MFGNFLNTLANVAANIITNPKFNFAQHVANVVHTLADYMGIPLPSPNTPVPSNPATNQESEEERRKRIEAAQRQQAETARQRKLARMEADFERDMAHIHAEVDDDDAPTTIPPDYVSTCADANLCHIGDPEIDKLTRLLAGSVALFATAVAVTGSLKGAVDLLLAQGIKLSAEALAQAVTVIQSGSNGTQYEHQTDQCNGLAGEAYILCRQQVCANPDCTIQLSLDPCAYTSGKPYQQCRQYLLGEEVPEIFLYSGRREDRRAVLTRLGLELLTTRSQTGMTDLDILVALIEEDALTGISSKEISDDISYVVSNSTGTLSYINAFINGSVDRLTGVNSVPLSNFQDSGFHVDYRDYTNQVFHVWPALNSVAQGGRLIGGEVIVDIGSYMHEDWGFPDLPRGGNTIQDTRLTYAGVAIGVAINEGMVEPEQLGGFVKRVLSSPYQAEVPYDTSTWPSIFICKLLYGEDNPNCQPDVTQRYR